MERRRATDPNRSLKIYDIERIVVYPDQPVLYYLDGIKKRSFVREQLQYVPYGTMDPSNVS